MLLFMGWCTVTFCTGNSSQNRFKIYVIKDSTFTKNIIDEKNILVIDPACFIPLEHLKNSIGHSKIYWLYLKPELVDTSSVYIVSLNERFSKIVLYTNPYSNNPTKSGLMVPFNQKYLQGSSLILYGCHSAFLIKIENRFEAPFKANDIGVETLNEYLNTQRKKNLFQGYAQGFLWLMLLYNLVLFVIARKTVHIYYVVYMLFNSLFLMFTSGLSGVYLFPDNLWLNLFLLTFQLLGVFFYVLFLRKAMMGHCTAYTYNADRFLLKPFALLIFIVNAAIGSTVFYRMDIYFLGASVSNFLSTLVGMVLFVFYWRKCDRFMQLIIIGSVVLFLLGYINVLYSLFYRQTEFFYTAGLLIELLVLTYALNQQYFKEQCEVEHQNKQLTHELEIKNRELVNIAMQLSAKSAVLNSVKEKLENTDEPEKNKLLYSEIELVSKATEVFWKDFEKHFNETHPNFYRNLNEKYPSLTANEIRLCAFLKLNLNTKEISMITLRSAHSIETMRSRIRHKLNLDRDDSITCLLSQL
jgi:hypothetical protein